MSSAIQPIENQLPGNSSVLCHNPLCITINRWLSQKANNYHKISTSHLIFAVVIHWQNNTFVRTKVSYFETYLCQSFMMRCYTEYLIWTIIKHPFDWLYPCNQCLFQVFMTHSQMLGKFEYTLPAKF